MDAWTTNTIQTADRVTAFLWKVYGWMAVGLGITAIVAFSVAGSPDLLRVLIGNRLVFFAFVIAQLGLVFFLSARADHLAPGTAAGLFALYSALTGVTLSVILLAYTGESITMTFVVTAGMFGALALFGSTTKRSLAGAGQFFMMGLVGLILASILGVFWHNDALQFLISVVGADRVLFGTDYPHQVHDMKGSMTNTAALAADICHAVREGNARHIFRL